MRTRVITSLTALAVLVLVATACLPATLPPGDTTTTEVTTVTTAVTTTTVPFEPQNVTVAMLDDATFGDIEAGYMPQTMALLQESGWHNFTQFEAQDPLCTPSRVTFQTGLTSAQHGVNCNTTADVCPNWPNVSTKTIQVAAQAAGYYTSLSGKNLNASGDCPGEKKVGGVYPNAPGWTDYHAIGGNSEVAYDSYNLIENGTLVNHKVSTGGTSQWGPYYTASVTQHAVETAPEPFYAVWTPSAPHAPGTPAPDYVPTTPTMAEHGPAFNEGCAGATDPDVSDKPKLERDLGDVSLCLGSSAWKYSKFLPSLQGVDTKIASMIAAMKARPSVHGGSVWDHTVFVLTSDNGQEKGDHGHTTKEMPRNRSLHLPLFIHVPGTASSTHPELAYMPDLPSTIADYMGVTLPVGSQAAGVSLRPSIEGTPIASRTVLLDHLKVQNGIADVRPWYAIRQDCTAQCYQLEWYPASGGIGEEWGLYDLTADPDYLHQLLGVDAETGYLGVAGWDDTNPIVAALKAELAARVAAGK